MARIRVGVRPWSGAEQPPFPDDAASSRNIVWTEIDGHRIDGHVVSVRGEWGEGAHVTTLEIVGVPEFVMLAVDGEPVEGPISAERAEEMLRLGVERYTRPDLYTEQKLVMAKEAYEAAKSEYEKTMAIRNEQWIKYQQQIEAHRG